MKQKKLTKQSIILLITVFLFILSAVLWSSFKIHNDVRNEAQNTLSDVASQNAVIVQLEIEDKFDLLYSIASEMSESQPQTLADMKQYQTFVDTYQFKRIGFVSAEGEVITTDGFKQDLSERDFYQDGMKGYSDITDTLSDHIGKAEPINVFSIPVYTSDNTICGVLFATYRNKQFESSLSVQSFDSQGFSCIISESGEMIACSSNTPASIADAKSIYDCLSTNADKNTESTSAMTTLLSGQTNGSGMFYTDGELYHYHAVPLDKIREDKQWFVLTIVPQTVLNNRSDTILSHVRVLLAIILLVIICGLCIYLYSIHYQNREIMKLAFTDELTGYDNFARFKERITTHNGEPGFYAALDLQDFKLINNTCGISKGDETLIATSKILKQNLSEHEFFARINADRFIIIFWEKEKAMVEPRLEKICKELSDLSVQLHVPRIFPLFGIYETKDHSEVEQNYGKATQAKHLIKGKRNRHYAFYDELNVEQLLENKQIENDFEDALRNKEFQIWYQPKVDPPTGRILGAEALVRWIRPDGTALSPAKFIPVFERNGNITVLDEYIFRAVCTQQQAWQDAGYALVPVSVNISRISLYFSNIVEKYRNILESYHLDPKYVPLEITESATINNSDIASLIEQFHKAGFTLLLDDFGSGYSSLSSLNEMHFDTIKLDKSLIDYIGDANGEKLLQYITLLLQNLGMSITAEGVETAQQVEFLKNLHCDDIQGFYFSKPLPLNEYEKFASAHK